MPELPEAEVHRENLTRWLGGRQLLEVAIPDARTRRWQDEAVIRTAAEGRTVRAVRRRGKFLRIELGRSGPTLLSHLGMSGKWALRSREDPDPPAARAFLRIAADRRVVFSDKRRFGHFSLCLPKDHERLARLGPEPLGAGFTARRLAGLLAAARRPVKSLLMDQDRIAGIGNIQATEALWRAGIHPARLAANLDAAEAKALHRAIRWTLRRSIRTARGAEILYVSDGAAGRRSTSARFSAYGRRNEPCFSCREAEIERVTIAGRSSFYCRNCQPPDPK